MKRHCPRVVTITAALSGAVLTVASQPCVAQGQYFPGGVPDGGHPLQLTQTAGPAPLNVRITGPDVLITKVRNWNGRMSIGGAGFSIDWGDGPRQTPMTFERGTSNNEDLFSHTYSVPGTYTINATTYRPGPNDGPIYNWKSAVSVTVGGDSEKKTTLQLLAPLGGETFNYQEFPTVRWSMSTDRRVNLYLQLVCENKVVAQDVVKGIAHNNPNSERSFSPPTFSEYENALKNGKTKFRMVLQMKDENGKTILARSSREFTMTNRYVPSMGGLHRGPVGADPLSVTLNYEVNHPSCFSYNLNWGDGSVDAEQKYDGHALLKMTNKVFKHRYKKPGVYNVVLRSTNLDPHEKLKDIVPIESIKLDLK